MEWVADVDGQPVVVELLGEDPATESGTLFRPHIKPPAGEGKLKLLCVRGVVLALQDVVEVSYGRFLAGTMTGPGFEGMRDEALLVWRQFAEEMASLSGG